MAIGNKVPAHKYQKHFSSLRRRSFLERQSTAESLVDSRHGLNRDALEPDRACDRVFKAACSANQLRFTVIDEHLSGHWLAEKA